MRRAAALPIATVDCFQKNGEVVYRSGNVFARPDCVWNRSDDAGVGEPTRPKTLVDAACWKTSSELFAQHDFPIVHRIEQPRGDTEKTAERLVSLNWTNPPIQCLQAACSRTGKRSSPLPVRCPTAAQGS